MCEVIGIAKPFWQQVCEGELLSVALILVLAVINQHIVAVVGFHDAILVGFCQCGGTEFVFFIGHQPHGIYDDGHGDRRTEDESLVGYDVHFRHIVLEVVCGILYFFLVSCEYGNLVLWRAVIDELPDGVGKVFHDGVFFSVGLHHLDAYIAGVGFTFRHILTHVGIGRTQFHGFSPHHLLQPFLLFFCGEDEELVVEVDYLPARTVVGVEGQYFQQRVIIVEFLFDAVEQPPVTVAPTVDALFHVAHNQVVGAMAHALVEKHLEVVPLQCACILKLVYHDAP